MVGGKGQKWCLAPPEALEALLTTDISIMLAGTSVIKDLRKFIRATDSSILAKLANSLAATPHWEKRLREYVNTTASIQVHQDSLGKFKASVGSPKPDMSVDDKIEDLTKLCKQACFLASELPTGALESLLEQLYHQVVGVLDIFLDPAGDPAYKQVSLGKMQRLLAECAICYPFKQPLEEYKAALAKAVSETVAAERQAGVMTQLATFMAAMETDQWQAELATLREKMQEAEGVGFDKEQVTAVQSALDKLDAHILWCVTNDAEKGLELEWAGEKVGELCALDRTELMHRQRNALFMSQCLAALSDKKRSIEEMVTQPSTRERVSELISWELSAKPMADAEGWGQQALTSLCAEARGLLNKFQGVEVSTSMAAVQRAITNLQDISGGAEKGARWDSGLAENAEWDAVVTQAQSTLLDEEKFNGAQLDETMHLLTEALPRASN